MPLTEIQGYANPTAVAERLIHEFDSLPWTYSLSIKCDNDFGQLFAQTIRNYQISDNAKLITPDEAYAKTFPLESGIEARDHTLADGLGLLLMLKPQSWDNCQPICKSGLGELLRNRCAYLIGTTHDQRKEILDEFKEIYDVRSKIVHRGKARLNLHERTLFSKLQWVCRRVIQEEIKLLMKDVEQNA